MNSPVNQTSRFFNGFLPDSTEITSYVYFKTIDHIEFIRFKEYCGMPMALFARKARLNTKRVPPGHSVILLKSSKFNMAAVSVKMSIIHLRLI